MSFEVGVFNPPIQHKTVKYPFQNIHVTKY